jgi:hypothetical protein
VVYWTGSLLILVPVLSNLFMTAYRVSFECSGVSKRLSTSAGFASPLFELAKPLAITIIALLRPDG